MNTSFGVQWGEWILSIVGGVIVLVISGVISRIYHRLEAIEVMLPKRMEQYQIDQAHRQEKLEAQLLNVRLMMNDQAIQLSALRATLEGFK